MPAIRRKFHYGNVVLSSEMTFPTNLLCGHTLPVRLINATTANLQFGGFVSAAFG